MQLPAIPNEPQSAVGSVEGGVPLPWRRQSLCGGKMVPGSGGTGGGGGFMASGWGPGGNAADSLQHLLRLGLSSGGNSVDGPEDMLLDQDDSFLLDALGDSDFEDELGEDFYTATGGGVGEPVADKAGMAATDPPAESFKDTLRGGRGQSQTHQTAGFERSSAADSTAPPGPQSNLEALAGRLSSGRLSFTEKVIDDVSEPQDLSSVQLASNVGVSAFIQLDPTEPSKVRLNALWPFCPMFGYSYSNSPTSTSCIYLLP